MSAVFTSCGCATSPTTLVDLAEGTRPVRPASVAGPVIDVHAHILCPEVDRIVSEEPALRSILAAQPAAQSEASIRHNMTQLALLQPRMTDPLLRIADMDAMGIDMQVISPSPTQYHYWAERDMAEQIVEIQNKRVVALCEAYPARFLGFGTVALQFPELAAAQLQRLMRHRAVKGVQISSTVGETALDDEALAPFWSAAEETGAVIFIHPLGTTLGSRVAPYYLSNVIGQPLETTIALWRLIMSGLLDRYPALKLLCAHGGGYAPTYAARSDQAWHVRPEARVCQRPPSSYLNQLWFDSLVYDPHALRRLADQVGIDRIVLGTDFPFDMGAYDPFSLVSADLFSPDSGQSILAGNAVSLFGVSQSNVKEAAEPVK